MYSNDYKRCIQGITQLMQQVMDLVVDHTGWKASFVCGGPEPAHGGRLNIIRYVYNICSFLFADIMQCPRWNYARGCEDEFRTR